MSIDQGDMPPLAPGATALYERFVALMRAGDIEGARELAPGVVIQTEGWPYAGKTGPLNPAAFQGDASAHKLMYWRDEGGGTYRLRSGAAWYTVVSKGDEYRISEGGLKPVE